MELKEIICTCESCPSQWDAITVENEPVYIRYRWGRLSVELSGKVIYSKQLGDEWDGLMSEEEIIAILKGL